ncbi:endonuclease/exonuclease/phosphatase family protein [Gymnodinialimonas sp. 2305UL16-5]|uniref:endonuclease/exonuclease/phosphatase family protein n=1 Tax=Gymnodinialimonas mytili TaxID=3126503 RepID=UPI0030AE5A02
MAGAAAALSAVALGSAALATLTPTRMVWGALARMLDAITPLILALALVFALLTLALGARKLGGLLVAASLIASAALYASYRAVTLPLVPDEEPALSVLFFNVEGRNRDSAPAILSAAMQSGADVLVFAEASALLADVDRLRDAYDFVSPCVIGSCELLIATNRPVTRHWQLRLNPVWSERYAVTEIETITGAPLFLVANHLAKPWLSGIAEPELNLVRAQYDWFDAPVVALGDYNMVPWTRPMRELLQETEFRAVRGQFATWPTATLPIGLPIDQVVVHGGPRIVSMGPFGTDLNSNHIGFVAEIALPAP